MNKTEIRPSRISVLDDDVDEWLKKTKLTDSGKEAGRIFKQRDIERRANKLYLMVVKL